MRRVPAIVFILAMMAAGASDLAAQKADDNEATGTPAIRREFRAAWVATVANIDWPSTSGLSTADQKKELVAILDKCVEINLNAVILQVRPACDALYASKLEPWSEYLTGRMGKAPEPFYDPLEFAVTEAHKRGLELHTWFNPYRARLKASKLPASPDHVSVARPELVRDYGSYLWLDPGMKEVQDHSLAVIRDVVERYDIDGIHIDDYFYPYKEKDPKTSVTIEFPDATSYAAYKKSGGRLARDDWRRDNVDKFVERMYREVKAVKPWVKVGISPFGIWKPGYPKQIKGFNQFEELYADAKLWLNKGWVDYWTPQLYWTISNPDQSYPVLLEWWTKENTKKRHVWPGLFTSQVSEKPDMAKKWHPKEVRYQIEWTRLLVAQPGHAHFSMKAFLKNQAKINDELTTSVYKEPALVPPCPWLDDKAPSAPSVGMTVAKGASTPSAYFWKPKAGEESDVRLWAVTVQNNGKYRHYIRPASVTSMEFPRDKDGKAFDVLEVRAVDRNGNASKPGTIKVKQGEAKAAAKAETAEKAKK